MSTELTRMLGAGRPISVAAAALVAWLCLAYTPPAARAGQTRRPGDEARKTTDRTVEGSKVHIKRGLELLPGTGDSTEEGLYRHGDYDLAWNRAGWTILHSGMPVLAQEDFEVVERIGRQEPESLQTRVDEEVVDKSEPRRMQLSATSAPHISQLVFLTNRSGIGRMRREVIITERGVTMRWIYTSFGTIGGHGLVRITLPAQPIEKRGLTLVGAEGNLVKPDLSDPKVIESLAEGLTAPQLRIDHGHFQSRWHWAGAPKRFRLTRKGAGMVLVLPFSFRGGQVVTVSLRVTDVTEPIIKVGDWRAELREQQLHVAYGQDARVIVGDFARLAGKAGVDLVAAARPRDILTEQGDWSGALDIQTVSRQFGWLRRRISAGADSVTIRYNAALVAEGTSCRTGLLLGPCWRQNGVLMRYTDGRVEKLTTQPPTDSSDPLVSIETTVGGKRLSMAFISEGGHPFAWRLRNAPDAPLEVSTTTLRRHRLAGEVILRLMDIDPHLSSPQE